MTFTPGLLATNEFAFRYMAPQVAASTAHGLNAAEAAYLHDALASAPVPGRAPPVALAALLRELVLGRLPDGSAIERVLAVLLQVHLPGTVTPYAAYGVHASYPSPRAYYPLRFTLHDRARGDRWQLDLRRMRMTPLGPSLPVPGQNDGMRFEIGIQADLHVYAPLYSLFRISLFALEAGHFLAEFVHLAAACGLRVQQRVDAGAVCVGVDGWTQGADSAAAFAEHLAFARSRNSGRYTRGFFPAPCVFGAAELAYLASAILAALAAVARRFPYAGRMRLSARLCLRDGAGMPAGIYRCDAQGLALVDSGDPVDACERLYSYDNVNFRNVPAMVFLCVDALAYHCTDEEFVEMNIALGFANQACIRALHHVGLIGRPFRSYDQHGIDRLLWTDADGLRTYYGLLVARNRFEDALGIVR